MVSKTEKLAERLNNINLYLTNRVKQEPSLSNIIFQVNQLVDALKAAKLRVKIIGRVPTLVHLLKNITNNNPSLQSLCQFQTVVLPVSAIETEVITLQLQTKDPIRYKLDKEKKVLTIGRDADCDILIPEQYQSVTRKHAELRFNLFHWEIANLNNQNSLYVNGDLINTACTVQYGDSIILGNFNEPDSAKLIFETSNDYGIPVLLRLKNLSPGEPTYYSLPLGEKLLIGRHSNCQIQIPQNYNSVSRNHAEIISQPEGVYQLRDLKSKNGTFVNGKPLTKNSVYNLKNGDKINFGSLDANEGMEVIFCFQSQAILQFSPNVLFKNSDVICFIYNPNLQLHPAEIKIIEDACKATQLLIIINEEKKYKISAQMASLIDNYKIQHIFMPFFSQKTDSSDNETLLLDDEYYKILEAAAEKETKDFINKILKQFISEVDLVFNQRETELNQDLQKYSQFLEDIKKAEDSESELTQAQKVKQELQYKLDMLLKDKIEVRRIMKIAIQ